MIIQATNGLDHSAYCASLIESHKVLRVPYRATTEGPERMLAELWGPFEFRIRYEASIWRGTMRPLKPFTKPLLLIAVDDTLRRMTKAQFAQLISSLLRDECISELVEGSDPYDRFIAKGFQALPHALRHFPSFQEIKMVCLNATSPNSSADPFSIGEHET